MDTYFRVARQKIADRLGFMCAQVIADDVNGSFWSLTGDEIFQKGDELCTGWRALVWPITSPLLVSRAA